MPIMMTPPAKRRNDINSQMPAIAQKENCNMDKITLLTYNTIDPDQGRLELQSTKTASDLTGLEWVVQAELSQLLEVSADLYYNE